jgi:hypothetical protein
LSSKRSGIIVIFLAYHKADWVLYREYDDANNTETIRRDDGRSFSSPNNRPLHCWRAAAQPERRLGRRRHTNHPEQYVEDSGSV